VRARLICSGVVGALVVSMVAMLSAPDAYAFVAPVGPAGQALADSLTDALAVGLSALSVTELPLSLGQMLSGDSVSIPSVDESELSDCSSQIISGGGFAPLGVAVVRAGGVGDD
jgi:hypothetical protein